MPSRHLACALVLLAGCVGTSTSEPTGDPTGGVVTDCERLDGTGDVAWYLRCGSATSERIVGVAVDPAGNTIVGFDIFNDEDQGAPFRIGDTTITPGDHYDFVLAKFDPAGEPLWARQFGGPDTQSLTALRGCGDGFALTGVADPGTVDLGGGPFTELEWIAVLDGDGEHRWSRSIPATDESGLITHGFACDADAGLLVSGQVSGALDLGGGPIPIASFSDGVVVRYDRDGAYQWARTLGATDGFTASVRAVTFTPDGSVAIAGAADADVDLGAGPLANLGEDDVIVGRYTAAGELQWAHSFGPGGLQYGMTIASDADGALVVGGIYRGGITLGPDTLEDSFPDASETEYGTLYDGFLAWFDPAGQLTRTQKVGSMLDDEIHGLAFDPDGTLVMSAYTDQVYTLRALTDGVPGFTWTRPEFERTFSAFALSGRDVILGAAPGQAIDLGGGSTADRGGSDLFLVRLSR